MTPTEAIYKLENYDELEGKYNEALARIYEYERELKEIADKANKALENPGVFTDRKALTEIADMLTVSPTYSDDDLEIGDIVKDDRDGEIGMYVGKGLDGVNHVLTFRYNYNEEFCDTFLTYSTEHWKKTGEHCPQIAEILSKVRGENDESSENPK